MSPKHEYKKSSFEFNFYAACSTTKGCNDEY